ncbi:MAG: hypothetical protein SF053_02710 [Bacteroidia bacterium]|nr:hypothetical protein [Bacteroidia bacterium]
MYRRYVTLFTCKRMVTQPKPYLTPEQTQDVIAALTYKGKAAAIRMYMDYTGCLFPEARRAVFRIGQEIEPGQAA